MKETKTPQQILDQAREEFEKKFDGIYYGKDFDGLPNYPPEGFREDVFNWHTSTLQAFIETEIERLGGMKKRMDVGDFGVDSVSFPSGEIWTQEKRAGFNQAVSDQIIYLKQLKI